MYDNNKSEYKNVVIKGEMMTEKQFKLTVQDNTNIEVKVNFTDVDSKELFIYFMVWLNIWNVTIN